MTKYIFADCELDTASHVLAVAGIPRHVEPKVLDLVTLLVEHAGDLVSYEDLNKRVWGGRVVTNSAVSVAINAARRAVKDDGRRQEIIRTVPRRGLKLAVSVSAVSETWKTGIARTDGADPASNQDKPIVAVFPLEFENQIDGQDYLARGLADDIATELSRFRALTVLSTLSTFQRDASESSMTEFASTLGATHVVDGTIRTRDKRIRLTIKLSDMTSNTLVWSERYDIDLEEIFEFRDDAVAKIVGSLFSRLNEFQLIAARRKPTSRLSAYDCVLRGLRIYKSGHVTSDEARQALFWFDRAVDIDPEYARALAWRACAAANLWRNPPEEEDLVESMESVGRALEIDPADHEVHRLAGALHCIQGNHDRADYHLSKSVDLNPNDAHILLRIGYYKSFIGRHDEDLRLIDMAIERNPLHPDWYWLDRGVVLFSHRKYRQSLANLQRYHDVLEINDVYRAACHIALGESANARKILAHLQRSNPNVNLEWIEKAYPFRCYSRQSRTRHLIRLLREAGMR